jgi:hypothetical protein
MPDRPVSADTVFVGGHVMAMDPARPVARAVAIGGGRIEALAQADVPGCGNDRRGMLEEIAQAPFDG